MRSRLLATALLAASTLALSAFAAPPCDKPECDKHHAAHTSAAGPIHGHSVTGPGADSHCAKHQAAQAAEAAAKSASHQAHEDCEDCAEDCADCPKHAAGETCTDCHQAAAKPARAASFLESRLSGEAACTSPGHCPEPVQVAAVSCPDCPQQA